MNPSKLIKRIRSTTARLALTYLLIIMVMSIGFSVVFYHASYSELGRQIPPDSFFAGVTVPNDQPDISGFLSERVNEGRHDLLLRLFFVNAVVLLVGSIISYWLADRAMEPIERSVEAQVQFVSNASHELKTPLTAIRTTNEVALRKSKLSLSDSRKIIRQNVEDVTGLQKLTDNLLKLASDDYNLELKPVTFQDAASDAINVILPVAQSRGVSIEDETANNKVLADQARLQQAILVLLDNAVKYSPSKAHVKLTSFTRAKTGYLKVSDEGSGIAKPDLPYIFDRFYRADQARSRAGQGGYGLGLAIAKKLVEEQHGEISVKNNSGKGATFTVKLPAV